MAAGPVLPPYWSDTPALPRRTWACCPLLCWSLRQKQRPLRQRRLLQRPQRACSSQQAAARTRLCPRSARRSPRVRWQLPGSSWGPRCPLACPQRAAHGAARPPPQRLLPPQSRPVQLLLPELRGQRTSAEPCRRTEEVGRKRGPGAEQGRPRSCSSWLSGGAAGQALEKRHVCLLLVTTQDLLAIF